MKRQIISASTAAILTAATMNIPAIVSYAATASTDAFFVDCGVTVIDSLEKSDNVLVPVTVDKDITINSASFTFDIFTRNSFDTATITGIDNLASKDFNASYKDNVVTLTATKDVTIKKGTKLFDLKMDPTYITSKKNGKVVEATEIVSNRFIYIKLKALSAKDSAGNTFTMSETCLNNTVGEIITTAKIKTDTSMKIDSVESSSRKVEVPVYITGKVGIGIIGFKVSKNAKITAVTPSKELRDAYGSNSSLVINEIASLEAQSKEFKNEQLCTLTVEIPATAATGETFDVKVNHLDLSAEDGSYSVVTDAKGVVTYTGTASSNADKYLMGDVNLDGIVNAEDATFVLKESNRITMLELGIEGTNELKNVIMKNCDDNASIDELLNIAKANGDVNDNGGLDPDDATKILKFINAQSLNDFSQEFANDEEIWNSILKKK